MNLIEKVALYRKLLNKQCGINTELHYERIYTDPRKNGMRSKYWSCSETMPVKLMKKFVSTYPEIKANGKRYSVSLDTSNYHTTKWYHTSVSLKFKSIN
jgi:hypothetical protein